MSSPKVVIIGGGLAGLTTGTYLARHGLTNVEVLEARSVPGGQVASWEDKDGDVVETGIHLAFPWYRNLPRLYEDIGSPLNLVETDGNYYIMDGESGDVEAARGGLDLMESLHGMLTFPGLTMSDRLHLARMIGRVLAMSGQEVESWDGHNVAQWLDQQGASQRLKRQLAVASVTIQGLPPAQASAASFMKFFRHLYGTEGQFESAFFDGPIGEVLVDPLVATIQQAGGQVQTNTSVSRIKTASAEISDIVLEDGGRISDADYVVLAVPGHKVPDLLAPPMREEEPFARLQGMSSARVYCLQLWYDEQVLPDGNVRISNRQGVLFDGVCDKAHHWSSHSGGSILQVLIDAAHDLQDDSDEEVYQRVLDDLARFFPGCREAAPRKWTMIRHSEIYCETRPGYWARVPREHQTPISRLYLAGDYTDGPYHYGMDSAVISGKRVARQILAREGHQDLPAPPLPVEVPTPISIFRRSE